jgi:molybdate transport system substrate-binding protein
VLDAVTSKLVIGTSIAQAYQFVDTKNAELGFVALSQVAKRTDGSRWLVPQQDYTPLAQDAVLLTPGKDSAGAKAFLDFLKSDDGVAVIKSFGYEVGK